MIVIEYKGYYEILRLWGFDEKCKCTKRIRVRDSEVEQAIKGAYVC